MINAHQEVECCNCAYYDSDGKVVEALGACIYHPPGSVCEHGKAPHEPCMPCRDELWGKL